MVESQDTFLAQFVSMSSGEETNCLFRRASSLWQGREHDEIGSGQNGGLWITDRCILHSELPRKTVRI